MSPPKGLGAQISFPFRIRQLEHFQLIQTLEMRESFAVDLVEDEREPLQLDERLEVTQPGIGDFRRGQVENF
jgi:hypothetical protein